MKSLLSRFSAKGADVGLAAPLGKLLAFYGAKGGVGTTTIAINTAIALHAEQDRRVVLVDGVLQFGDHRVFLDLGNDRKSISELSSVPHDRRGPHGVGPRPPRLGDRPAPRPAEPRGRRPRHGSPDGPDPRRAPDDVRLRDRRRREAARRPDPLDPRPCRPDLHRHDRRPVVPQERPPCARGPGPDRLRGLARSSSCSTGRTRSPASASRPPRAS